MNTVQFWNSKTAVALFSVALFFLLVPPIFSIDAVVEETNGKVEMKPPGGNWETAEAGMTVSGGTTVSTGFNSKALISIGESVLEIEALTRMALEELIEREGTIDTKLHLKVGKVKAEVRSTRDLRNNFRLRSPVSTAAVRGTSFEYDGYTLWVEEGTVVMGNRIGQTRTVGQGEESSTDGFTGPSSGEQSLASLFEVITSTSGEGGLKRVETETDETALVVITLQWD
jgi:hypothetical protein